MRTVFSLILLLLQILAKTSSETIGEKILRKIVQTCGVPTIKNVMRNLTLNPGESARFHCKVDMKCMVSYIHWYHEYSNGSVRLLRTGASAGTPYRYSINKVDVSDTGFYSCVAGNILGESVSSAYLQINRTSSLAPWPWLAVTALSLLFHCCCQHIKTLSTPLLWHNLWGQCPLHPIYL